MSFSFYRVERERETNSIEINVILFLVSNESKPNNLISQEITEGVNCIFGFVFHVQKVQRLCFNSEFILTRKRNQHFDKKTQNVCVDFNGD